MHLQEEVVNVFDFDFDVDFDFKILTAFIRLGRAGPVRGRVPSILLFGFRRDKQVG